MPTSPITPGLIAAIRAQYRLDWDGIHGWGHWQRVREIGLRLAQRTGADPGVVEIFAYLHDACRQNDDSDPEHGMRAAVFAGTLRGVHFELQDHKFDLLCHAMTGHSMGEVDDRAEVGTCWDADRLDLGRVHITPVAHRLCTSAAREKEFFDWAIRRHRAS
jgi:uncharacterized protein